MKKIYLVCLITAIALCSCSSTDSGQETVEVYSGREVMRGPKDGYEPETIDDVPQDLLDALKPRQEDVVGEVAKDTIDLKETTTYYRLVLRNQNAELTVTTQAAMQAREMRKKASYYVFSAGRYDINGIAMEVRADGIYLDSGKRIWWLNNFRFPLHSTNEVVSSSDFTKQLRKTIAKGEASGNVFMVSKADTIYKLSRLSDIEIRIDMVSPEKWNDWLDMTLKKEL